MDASRAGIAFAQRNMEAPVSTINSIRRPSTRASVWKWPLSARASVTLRELEAAGAGAGDAGAADNRRGGVRALFDKTRRKDAATSSTRRR